MMKVLSTYIGRDINHLQTERLWFVTISGLRWATQKNFERKTKSTWTSMNMASEQFAIHVEFPVSVNKYYLQGGRKTF